MFSLQSLYPSTCIWYCLYYEYLSNLEFLYKYNHHTLLELFIFNFLSLYIWLYFNNVTLFLFIVNFYRYILANFHSLYVFYSLLIQLMYPSATALQNLFYYCCSNLFTFIFIVSSV